MFALEWLLLSALVAGLASLWILVHEIRQLRADLQDWIRYQTPPREPVSGWSRSSRFEKPLLRIYNSDGI